MCKQTIYIRQQYLTEREAEIMLYYALGLSIKQTAERLFISLATVKRHREKWENVNNVKMVEITPSNVE